ncbi:diguanylate cyclase domain-containing protein [Marinisporobacter balticus]|uniref:GGDEF domain-containing protein n=1 Tax=Marinisporobacter balticus TaxID=2018667 RepID=A0A4R2K9G1_9FIRM|nr:diguanylate cyclase [Marinisporobacter balticus]TCO69364.1 GGDEF domain-containing protein [Marinisporobacter balticus]
MLKEINTKASKKIDLIDTATINIFFLLIVVFAYGELEKESMNFFILLSVMIGIIISYYTNITFAILCSIVFDFLYASTYIFLNITKSEPIKLNVYFWMIIVPVLMIIFAYKGKLTKDIQIENYKLKQENREMVMIDKETGLRNAQSFFDELQGFMNINKRYGLIVYLMLVKIKYDDTLLRIIGRAKYDKTIKVLSKAIDGMLRMEDKKYLLREQNMFGIIFLTQNNDGEIVKSRLKNIIKETKFEEELINKIKIEVLVGLVQYDKDQVNSAIEFFEIAQKDMEYDV